MNDTKKNGVLSQSTPVSIGLVLTLLGMLAGGVMWGQSLRGDFREFFSEVTVRLRGLEREVTDIKTAIAAIYTNKQEIIALRERVLSLEKELKKR